MMFLIITISFIVYGLINFYVGSKVLLWLKVIWPMFPSWLFCLIYAFLASAIFIGYIIPVSFVAKTIHLISNFWLGIFLYLLLAIALVDLLRLISKLTSLGTGFRGSPQALTWTGCLVLMFVLGSVIYGLYSANKIHIKEYEITMHKQTGQLDALNVVLISDVHLGYNIGEKHISKIVESINMLDADLVCIAGDMFDNHFASIENIEGIIQQFRSLQTTYGVYACLGNHDVDTRGDTNTDMLEFFHKAGITLLQDQVVLVDDLFYIVGRLDAAPIGVINHKRKPIIDIIGGLDKSKPIIVMDHRPIELAEVEAGGGDLLLSGHTHKGQVFPGNLVTKRIFEVDYGYEQKGNLHVIVTSGVGTWGPPLRLGTQSEMVNIHIKFSW